jgi:excinuclease UvrABC nuclease subunit
MVVFENGQPSKENYRIFNIKDLAKGDINDFDSLYEVLKRRLKYLSTLPDKYTVKNKNQTLSLIHKKEAILNLNYQELENQTVTLEFAADQDLSKFTPDLLEGFLKTCIQKLKAKRYLINSQQPELTQTLTEIGFITIENQNYNFGYYTQKQIYDKSFTTKPDLIIIDGGKGQLSATLKAKKLYKCSIPFISIAKKFEELFTEDKQKIILPLNSPILNLIQQLRNEAHRFAITKNRKDRLKKMIQ